MTVQLIAPPLSPDDYRTLEEHSETRHEYCNGERILTIGGSYRHSQIITNLVVLLATALADTDIPNGNGLSIGQVLASSPLVRFS